MHRRVLLVVLSLVWVRVETASNSTGSGTNWSIVLRVFENCADKKDSLSCLQQKIFNFANRATEAKSLEIFDGLKFVRDETSRDVNEPKSMDEERGTPASFTDKIVNKIEAFFRTHSVEVNLPKFLRPDDEARKKKGGYGGVMLLAGAMKGAMLYMGMHAVAALAGKALIVAKIALTLASVIALKKLLEGGGGKTSYEIVKHPQHSYVQTHSSSHEYGGQGGHGGGYEGHYRKRSIPRTKQDDDHELGTLRILAATVDASRHLPRVKKPSNLYQTYFEDSQKLDQSRDKELRYLSYGNIDHGHQYPDSSRTTSNTHANQEMTMPLQPVDEEMEDGQESPPITLKVERFTSAESIVG